MAKTKKKTPTLRSGNPELAAKARETEQTKKSKAYKEPKPVGANFRKFSQIIIVVMILAGLLLSGLGSIANMRNNEADTVDNSSSLTDVNGNPITGETPVEGTPIDEAEWSEVSGLENDPTQSNEIPPGVPVEIPVEEPAK